MAWAGWGLIGVCLGLDGAEPQEAGFERVRGCHWGPSFAGRAHHRHGPKCTAVSLEQLAVRGARGPLRGAHLAQVSTIPLPGHLAGWGDPDPGEGPRVRELQGWERAWPLSGLAGPSCAHSVCRPQHGGVRGSLHAPGHHGERALPMSGERAASQRQVSRARRAGSSA